MADNSLLEKVLGLQEKYEALQAQLSDPEVIGDMKKFVQLNKEYKELTPIIEAGNEFKRILENYEMAKEILATEKDEDLREMAKEEIAEIEAVFRKICDAEITDYNFPWHELMSEARKALDEVSRR